jgi:ABC-type antimicrobial peptide transport system permease subunit
MGGATMLVYAEAPPAAVAQALRREIANLSGEVVLTEPETIARHIDDSIFQDRILATLSGFFGVVALVLAAVGLYGVVAYGTEQRSREIGVRIALGARRSSVLWMVVGDALLLVCAGLTVGLPLAIAAARGVSAVLAGVPAAGVAMFASSGTVLLVVGTMAALVPARRAARMDPMTTLRQE